MDQVGQIQSWGIKISTVVQEKIIIFFFKKDTVHDKNIQIKHNGYD